MAGEVAIVAAGQCRFGARGEGPKELFAEAWRACRDTVDRDLDVALIQEAYVGSMAFGGYQLGNTASLPLGYIGLPHLPSRRVENACASSSFALRDGYIAIRSAQAEVVLVAGLEKMTDLPTERQKYWLGVSGDTEWERLAGTTFAGTYALMAQRHMHDYRTTKEQMALVAVKNHRHGARNPKAHLQREITLEQVLNAPMVANPLGLYDCCPVSDGAAVVLLASKAKAKLFTDTPVWIEGSGAANDYLGLHERPSITRMEASVRAGRMAFQQAGLKPDDVDLAEIHDCFTIAEIMALEDLGFCPKGRGGSFVESGATQKDGQIPVNLSGGLKAKGHPLGATGAAQVVEVFHQLRGTVEKDRQVGGAQVALTHNVGGSGASCTVHIYGR